MAFAWCCEDHGLCVRVFLGTCARALSHTPHARMQTPHTHERTHTHTHTHTHTQDCDSAREILERATKVEFRSMEDLANVWCEWVEMELRHDEFQKALQVLHKANVCVCARARSRVHAYTPPPPLCVCVCVFVCVCMYTYHIWFVCIYISTYLCISIYIYVYIGECAAVAVAGGAG